MTYDNELRELPRKKCRHGYSFPELDCPTCAYTPPLRQISPDREEVRGGFNLFLLIVVAVSGLLGCAIVNFAIVVSFAISYVLWRVSYVLWRPQTSPDREEVRGGFNLFLLIVAVSGLLGYAIVSFAIADGLWHLL